MPQMKEQEKTPEKVWNEMEAPKMPDAEFKTMLIRMLKKLLGKNRWPQWKLKQKGSKH